LKKLKVPIAFYVLLILCNKAFLFILNGLMLDIIGLTTDLSVSFNYGFEAAMMY
jgi:hypothetical protein